MRVQKEAEIVINDCKERDWRKIVMISAEGVHNLGRLNVFCFHCNSLHWFDKDLVQSSKKLIIFRKNLFQGKVFLSFLISLSLHLKCLFEDQDTRTRKF